MSNNTVIKALLETMPEDVQEDLLEELKRNREAKSEKLLTSEQIKAINDRIMPRF